MAYAYFVMKAASEITFDRLEGLGLKKTTKKFHILSFKPCLWECRLFVC